MKKIGGVLCAMTIEKTADNLLEKAIHLSATDIHIIPRKKIIISNLDYTAF